MVKINPRRSLRILIELESWEEKERMNPFSEIEKLTKLVLKSEHIKLISDFEGRIQSVSARENETSRFFPVPLLVGKTLADCTNIDLARKILEMMVVVVQEQVPCVLPMELSLKGLLIQLDCDITPIPDQKLLMTLMHQRAEPEMNIPPIPDHELSKQSEISLLHQATRLLVEEDKGQCFVMTPAGKFIFSNHAFQALIGYSQTDLNDMLFSDLIVAEQRDMMARFLNNPLANQSQSLEVTFVTKTGEEVVGKTTFITRYDDFQNLLIIGKSFTEVPQATTINDTIQEKIIQVASKLLLPILMIEERTLEILFANAATHQYYEFDAGELNHKNFLDLFPASENQHLLELLRAQSTLGLESEYAWRQITRNGAEKKSRFFINSLSLDGKKIMMVLIRDFVQEPANHLIQENQDAEYIIDQDLLRVHLTPTGIVTQINQAFCEILGKPVQKIIGKTFEENLFLEDYQDIFQHFSLLTPQNPVRKNRNRIIDGSGKTLWIEWTDRGIFKGDQLVEIHALGKNITTTYQSELLQNSMEQRYQALVENLPMVIYVIHAKTFFPIYISPQVEQLTGYTPEEFYKDPQVWINAMHPDDAHKFYEMLQERIEKKITGPVEFRMIHKDGHMVWAEEIGSTIELPDGTVLFQGVSRDVTESHVNREKLIYYSNFERLINGLSLKLIKATPENFDEILQSIVDELGKFMQVDRAYIFDFNHKLNTMSNTFEWCHSGVAPMIDRLQNVKFSDLPWWTEKINHNREIVLNQLSDLPQDASGEREILSAQNIKSLLVVPIIHDGTGMGFIGFDMVNEEIHWEPESIHLLRLVSAMIISTRERFVDINNEKPTSLAG